MQVDLRGQVAVGIEKWQGAPSQGAGAKPTEQNFFEESPCRLQSEVRRTPIKKLGGFRVSG